ncbi:protein THEM6-like [Onthophagus taurus]|uniref:protein THEM6-like n=1 Tax=Onthophagus taurus TaxID=166361 RepID=UPI000C2039D1|nr:protein THEM6-like [Onthophagus taurus]
MVFCFALVGVCALILILYGLFELHYFLRICLSVILARFKTKIHVLDEATVRGICVTSDIDTLLFHMNNARYMRELDFARVDFYERTGLYRCIKSKGGGLVMGATTIRYRRFVKLFHKYILTSKVTYWDDQNIYMEHRFISPGDRFINAIVMTKTRLINCNAEEIMQEMILSKNDPEYRGKTRPEIPPDLEKWMESNTISSQALRGVV